MWLYVVVLVEEEVVVVLLVVVVVADVVVLLVVDAVLVGDVVAVLAVVLELEDEEVTVLVEEEVVVVLVVVVVVADVVDGSEDDRHGVMPSTCYNGSRRHLIACQLADKTRMLISTDSMNQLTCLHHCMLAFHPCSDTDCSGHIVVKTVAGPPRPGERTHEQETGSSASTRSYRLCHRRKGATRNGHKQQCKRGAW